MQADSHGNIWIVEDSGGKAGTLYPHAKQPNSFVFRFIPKDRSDLTKGGKLQALQVASKAHAGPIVFNAADIDGDITSQDQKDLHTYGNVFHTQWVTVHDTDVDGTTAFNANAAAKAAEATPFKRPENGQFRPGSGFREFYFAATGDTTAKTEAAAIRRIWRHLQADPEPIVEQRLAVPVLQVRRGAFELRQRRVLVGQ